MPSRTIVIREVEMSGELDKDDSLLLSSKDRADGFSIMADSCHNITLLKWSRPVAWFSVTVPEEMLRASLEMLKDRARDAKR